MVASYDMTFHYRPSDKGIYTCCHLVAQTTATAMDHDTHLSCLLYTHLAGIELVVNLIYHLDLCIVVPCSQCS